MEKLQVTARTEEELLEAEELIKEAKELTTEALDSNEIPTAQDMIEITQATTMAMEEVVILHRELRRLIDIGAVEELKE